MLNKPDRLPKRPNFSCGPCAKRPGWNMREIEANALLGRSHRSSECKKQLKLVTDLIKENLSLPEDYMVAILPASNTGAFEAALWSMLGPLPVDALAWESFGYGWVNDIKNQLSLSDVRVLEAKYGEISDLSKVREGSDVCFTWNGTTSGVRIPNADWISDYRLGITFCDATSAIFSQEIAWEKLDVITFSWQKAMGGEGGHGVIILSPKAINRLENFSPDRPIPKVLRLGAKNLSNSGLFEGGTINTPSMLCVADALDSLLWIKEIGGWKGTYSRCQHNFKVLSDWYQKREWITNLVRLESIQSNTSVCLEIIDQKFLQFDDFHKWEFINKMTLLLEKQGAAFDIKGHRDGPPTLRIWCGPTVEKEDLECLLPWLDWAFQFVRANKF